SAFGQDITEASAKAIMKGAPLSSFENAQGVAHSTYNNVINDHSQSITQLQEAFNQFLLQGNAIVFPSNNTYTPTAGVVSIEVIILGGGAGGGGGRGDGIPATRAGGGGGGGGGEVHTVIPAALLPVDGSGNFLPISITIGAGGAGGAANTGGNGGSGTGGGNTSFGTFLTAGGGQGGVGGQGQGGAGGMGGIGMIAGGNGGEGAGGTSDPANVSVAGTNSVSPIAL